ncbi:hypothetical protein ALMP_40270 [Streptomyces sp. A012304]|nr:hypothetical protein ALMP_40270 [Streptomyces sp. A012304]
MAWEPVGQGPQVPDRGQWALRAAARRRHGVCQRPSSKDPLDSDQEFPALGAGALHGFPVSSSATRTALASSAGARSQVYPLVAGAAVLAVLRYDSPLFFANAEDFHRRALTTVDEQTSPVRWFVLNTEANVEVDITALDAVDALRRELTGRGIVFALARVKQDLMDDLTAYGLTDTAVSMTCRTYGSTRGSRRERNARCPARCFFSPPEPRGLLFGRRARPGW